MKISIPEPCHENWGAMTPNEQGRFCGSCQKTVVDFTNFSTDDIQNYFTKHYGQKVCGRFKQQQLNSIDIQIPTYLFSKMPSSRKFALALLVVFGTTLFSCTDNNGQPATLGEVTLVDTPKTTIDTNAMGKPIVKPITNVKHPVDFFTVNPPEIQGEIAMPINEKVEEVDTEEEIMGDTVFPTKPKEVLKGKVKISVPDTIKTNPNKIIHTMGMIAPDYKIDSIKTNSK
jgi:hypothetical protein